EGKNSFRPLRVAINSESHALSQESERSQFMFAVEFVFLQLGETLQQPLVMRPGLSRRIKHFVVEPAGIVFGEEFGHEITVSPPLRGANKNAVPHLKSSPTGKDTAKWRVIGLRRRNSTGRTLPSQCCLPEVCELNRRSHFLS